MGIGELLGWAIFGLVAGAIARLLHPGRDPMNWLWTMALGVGGALVGGFVGSQIGVDNQGLSGWVLAVLGAIALLIAHNLLTRRSAAAPGAGRTSDDYKRAVFDDLSRGPRG
jgi:uncharacterized membrane protein YeaQ/YmgE (transglycosylase-associated protein family)